MQNTFQYSGNFLSVSKTSSDVTQFFIEIHPWDLDFLPLFTLWTVRLFPVTCAPCSVTVSSLKDPRLRRKEFILSFWFTLHFFNNTLHKCAKPSAPETNHQWIKCNKSLKSTNQQIQLNISWVFFFNEALGALWKEHTLLNPWIYPGISWAQESKPIRSSTIEWLS